MNLIIFLTSFIVVSGITTYLIIQSTNNPFYFHNLISNLYRAYIHVMTRWFGEEYFWLPPLRWYHLKETINFGPSFWYKGDEIVWTWKNGFLHNMSLGGTDFNSLKDIDNFWREYSEHEMKTWDLEYEYLT